MKEKKNFGKEYITPDSFTDKFCQSFIKETITISDGE